MTGVILPSSMNLKKLDHEAVRKALKQKDQIPTLPTTFTELVRVTSDPETSLHELATIIAYDPTLMASVLKVANSSFMGLTTPVKDLSTAVLYLGMSEIRRAALAVGAFDAFMGRGGAMTYLKDIWIHSLATGLIAQNMASLGGFDFSEDAYIAGLLHDFGKLFFATSYSKEYATICAAMGKEVVNELDLEKEIFGLDHLEVIATIGKDWKLPSQVYQVAIHHHHPELSPPENRMITLSVAMANTLAHHMINDMKMPPERMERAQEWLKEIAVNSIHPEKMTMKEIGEILMEEAEELRCYEDVTTRPL